VGPVLWIYIEEVDGPDRGGFRCLLEQPYAPGVGEVVDVEDLGKPECTVNWNGELIGPMPRNARP
jgi:hypothetical protein